MKTVVLIQYSTFWNGFVFWCLYFCKQEVAILGPFTGKHTYSLCDTRSSCTPIQRHIIKTRTCLTVQDVLLLQHTHLPLGNQTLPPQVTPPPWSQVTGSSSCHQIQSEPVKILRLLLSWTQDEKTMKSLRVWDTWRYCVSHPRREVFSEERGLTCKVYVGRRC